MPTIYTVTPNPVLDRTITVPLLVENEVLRAKEVRLDWGGKGFNVSRALLAVGMPSVAMGFLGGATGDMLEEGLHTLGLETDFVRVDGETRTNVVIAEPTGRHIKVNEAGPLINERAQQALPALLRNRLQPDDICVLAGSLPPGITPDFYARLIRLTHECKGFAVLDASGEALRLGIAAGPDLVKPNALEAQQVTDQEIDTPQDAAVAARLIRSLGVGRVAISLRAEGLVLAGTDVVYHAQPPAIQEVINVGAGDAMVAGLVWALTQGFDDADVARWGVAFGTAAASLPGIEFGERAALEAVYAQTKGSIL